MPTSKGSSTRETTSSPSEREILRALQAPEIPLWSEEPLAALVASRLGVPPKAVRPGLDKVDVRIEIAGPVLGKLDETWLFRQPVGGAPFEERVAGLDGLVEWALLGDRYAIMRTFAQDAVEREKRLRELHKRLHERPVHQLHREHPALPKRKLGRLDWALLSAMRRKPFAPIDALATESGAALRAAKERSPKLAAEGLGALVATPRGAPLAHLILRVSPSSTAAARHAIGAMGDPILRAWIPEPGTAAGAPEASTVDASLLAPPEDWPALRAKALDVPGVASVEVLPVTRAWRDDAGIDALVKRAFSLAAGP